MGSFLRQIGLPLMGLMFVLGWGISNGLAQPEVGEAADLTMILSLEQAVELAERAHPRVEEAAEGLGVAQAQLDEARWAWFRGIGWENYFGATPVCTDLERQNEGLRCVGEVDVLNPAHYRPTFRGSVSVGVPLYTFGKLSSGRRLARAGVNVAEHRIDRAKGQVVFDVHRAYWSVLLSDILEGIAREGERRLIEAEDQLERLEFEDSDDYDPKDKMKLGYYQSQVVSRRLAAERFKTMASSGLKAAVGIDDPDMMVVPQERRLERLPFVLADLEDYQQLALQERPEAKELLAGIEARRAQVALARARMYPDLVVGGGARYQVAAGAECIIDPSQPSVCINDTYGYPYAALGVTWSFNLPQGRARVRQAQGELARLEAQAQTGVLALRLEIENVYTNVREKEQVMGVYQRGVRSARQWIISNAMDYEMGVASVKDLVDALVAHSQARVDLNQAIYEYNVAIAALARDTGVKMENIPGYQTSQEE